MTDKQKSKRWKEVAIQLSDLLSRFDNNCNLVHHKPSEYHKRHENCPVCLKILQIQSKFDELLSDDNHANH